MGYSSGYNGTYPFEKPGDLYNDPFLGCTLLGCAVVPFCFLTV